MTLNPVPSHPSKLCYVLKLHRDSQPGQGHISGVLEHVATGQSMPFGDVPGLISVLLAHANSDELRSRGHAGDSSRES
jgi:hypothetical protein